MSIFDDFGEFLNMIKKMEGVIESKEFLRYRKAFDEFADALVDMMIFIDQDVKELKRASCLTKISELLDSLNSDILAMVKIKMIQKHRAVCADCYEDGFIKENQRIRSKKDCHVCNGSAFHDLNAEFYDGSSDKEAVEKLLKDLRSKEGGGEDG